MRNFLILCLVVFLTACSTTKEVVVTKTEFISLNIPSEYLLPCKASNPPDKNVYISSNKNVKEDLLSEYIVELHSDIAICNNRVKSISSIYDGMKKTLKAKNEKTVQ